MSKPFKIILTLQTIAVVALGGFGYYLQRELTAVRASQPELGPLTERIESLETENAEQQQALDLTVTTEKELRADLFKELENGLAGMRSELANLRKSVQSQSSNSDQAKAAVSALEKRIESLAALSGQVDKIRAENASLASRLDNALAGN